jgi:uncharacterized membrane protein YoaK (UPF0700 family)
MAVGMGRPRVTLEWTLVLLTVVSGLVDAVSFVGLNQVFVANMTGNVVFLGFAMAGTSGLSAAAALVSLAAFLGGALLGGRLGSTLGERRRTWLGTAMGVQTALTVAATGLSVAVRPHHHSDYSLIVLLALAMGVQNATARRLGVPDMTTTVVTQTLTGLAADSPAAGGSGRRWRHRVLAVAALLAGALIGALLVLRVGLTAGLVAVLATLLAAAATLWAGADQPST